MAYIITFFEKFNVSIPKKFALLTQLMDISYSFPLTKLACIILSSKTAYIPENYITNISSKPITNIIANQMASQSVFL